MPFFEFAMLTGRLKLLQSNIFYISAFGVATATMSLQQVVTISNRVKCVSHIQTMCHKCQVYQIVGSVRLK